MQFHYRNEAFLKEIFSSSFEILQLTRYTEIEDNDSIFLLARRDEGTQAVVECRFHPCDLGY